MRRFITRFRKSFRYGEKGFTLIELLVVVAILGVLAAVIIPNVAKFLGTGLIESANTEAHNVQTAVVAYMADEHLSTYDSGNIGPETATASPEPEDFLLNPGGLQAIYTMNTDGSIASATTTGVTDSEWGDLVYVAGEGWQKPA